MNDELRDINRERIGTYVDLDGEIVLLRDAGQGTYKKVWGATENNIGHETFLGTIIDDYDISGLEKIA